jgi:hypothetical protein
LDVAPASVRAATSTGLAHEALGGMMCAMPGDRAEAQRGPAPSLASPFRHGFAAGGVPRSGSLLSRDSSDGGEQRNLPTANRIAGRVVLEMGLAMRVFERAHRWEKRVPLLVPGHGV